jgi:hypothetical protein
MTRPTQIPDTITETITVHVPFRVVKRGGRKEMHLPEGAAQLRRTDSTLIKALARAYRWKRLLDAGRFATIEEIAAHEHISASYLTRVMRLTLLAPDIIEEILDGRTPALGMDELLSPMTQLWSEQRALLGYSRGAR